MLQDGPARLGDCDSQRIMSHRHSRWFFVLHPSISAYPSARSDRKRGLAKLPLDDRLLRSCGTRPGRQLQHCRTLAIAQTRDQHHLPVGKFQRIVMGHGVVHIDLPEAREPLPDLLVRQDADAERRLAIDTLVECDLGTRQQADPQSLAVRPPRIRE